MSIVENKYHSTIKVEFRDLVENIVNSERKTFHIYTIHRLLSLGLLIDFPFEYIQTGDCAVIGIKLDLKDSGYVIFHLDIESNYGCVADEGYLTVLQEFTKKFDTVIGKKQSMRSLF